MYSILLKQSEKTYSYICNDDGTIYSGNSEATKTKLKTLLETYPLGKLIVVRNTTITSDFTIEDAE